MRFRRIADISIDKILPFPKSLHYLTCHLRFDHRGEHFAVYCPQSNQKQSLASSKDIHDVYIQDAAEIGEGKTEIIPESCKRILHIPIRCEGRVPAILDFLYFDDMFWGCFSDRISIFHYRDSKTTFLRDLPLADCLSLSVSPEKQVFALTLDNLHIFDSEGNTLGDRLLSGFHGNDSCSTAFRESSGFLRHTIFIQHDSQGNLVLFYPGRVKKFSESGELLYSYYYVRHESDLVHDPRSTSIHRKQGIDKGKFTPKVDPSWATGFPGIFAGAVNNKAGEVYSIVNHDGKMYFHVMGSRLEHKDYYQFPGEDLDLPINYEDRKAYFTGLITSVMCDNEGDLYFTLLEIDGIGTNTYHLKLVPTIIKCRVEEDIGNAEMPEPWKATPGS